MEQGRAAGEAAGVGCRLFCFGSEKMCLAKAGSACR
jgi:hypothetical protein